MVRGEVHVDAAGGRRRTRRALAGVVLAAAALAGLVLVVAWHRASADARSVRSLAVTLDESHAQRLVRRLEVIAELNPERRAVLRAEVERAISRAMTIDDEARLEPALRVLLEVFNAATLAEQGQFNGRPFEHLATSDLAQAALWLLPRTSPVSPGVFAVLDVLPVADWQRPVALRAAVRGTPENRAAARSRVLDLVGRETQQAVDFRAAFLRWTSHPLDLPPYTLDEVRAFARDPAAARVAFEEEFRRLVDQALRDAAQGR